MNPFAQKPAQQPSPAAAQAAVPTNAANPFAGADSAEERLPFLPADCTIKIKPSTFRFVPASPSPSGGTMGPFMFADVEVCEVAQAPANVTVGSHWTYKMGPFDPSHMGYRAALAEYNAVTKAAAPAYSGPASQAYEYLTAPENVGTFSVCWMQTQGHVCKRLDPTTGKPVVKVKAQFLPA
jgi:hypothetical protein